MNITACLVHKELSSVIGYTLLLEKALPLGTLKVVDASIMVEAVNEVDVVGVGVAVEEVESGVEANLIAKLHQS